MEKVKKALRWSCSNNEEDCKVGGKCNGSSSRASEGEEGDIFCEPLDTNGHSSRKRVKLQDKASEGYISVDLVVVPRKLRSAINKQLSQSASPPLSDSKRRQLHTLNGIQSSNGCSAERYRQNMLDQVTKDEEEVAEALTQLASSITISMPIRNTDNMKNLGENSETTATSTSLSEGFHEVVLEAEPAALEQPIAASITQNFNASGIETTTANSDLTLLSNNRKESDITCLRVAMSSSDPLGTSLQFLAGNGGLQQAQLDASSMQKHDLGLWHLGSASMEKDLPSIKQNLIVSGTSLCRTKKEATGGWLGLPSTDHAQLTISSSKTTGSQRSISASTRCSSTRNDLPTEMLPPPATDKRTACKKCATHVYISYLVRNYQNAEKNKRSSAPNNQSKDKEGRSMMIGYRNGMIPHLTGGYHMERSSLEGSSRMVQDGRLVQAHMASTLTGDYSQQKHGGDHFSISAAGDAKNSGNVLQSSGQLPVHYLQHHSLMSFPFARGPYSSHYQEQLTAAADQQVPMQMQQPHYMSTGPLYGSQMVQVTGGTTTKQQQHKQQQIWQAQLAHYGSPLGFQEKWQQNGQHPDSFQPSSSFHTRGPSSIFPFPKASSSSLPSRPKHQHQHNGGGFNLESSSQLQMLCNVETFR